MYSFPEAVTNLHDAPSPSRARLGDQALENRLKQKLLECYRYVDRMAAPDVTNGVSGSDNTVTMSSAENALQQRYMELLEKRIAQLEALVEPSSKQADGTTSGKPDAAAGKKDGDAGKAKSEDKATETSSDSEKKPKSRYRNVKRQWNSTSNTHVDVELDETLTKDENVKTNEIAFTFRRVYPEDNKDEDESRAYSEIDIESLDLRNLLKKEIGTDYPGQNLDGDTINIVAPFPVIIHNWDKLLQASKRQPDDSKERQSCEDLAKLLDTVKMTPELDKYFKSRDANANASLITYETLWTLFPPKSLLISKVFMNTEQAFELCNFMLPDTGSNPRKQYICAWCYEYNGESFSRAHYNFEIERFKGTKDIHDLDIYPIQYYGDGSEGVINGLKQQLIERGNKYDKIAKSKVGAEQMWSYKGIAIFDKDPILTSSPRPDDDSDDGAVAPTNKQPVRQQRHIKGHVLIDSEAFLQFSRSTPPLGDKDPNLFVNSADSNSSVPTDEDVQRETLLRPPRLLGYSTKEKRWGQYALAFTKEAPGKNPEAFSKKLELDQKYKAMIQALVEEHAGHLEEDPSKDTEPSKVQVKDIVGDKGKGLVLLLHGPPGVGKTLTAETIAEATGKPLFIVSVAEIGLNASKAERNLEQLFYLAGRWESVLLVDEADVFLESRSENSDPNRNALVSVLLRVLEYYNGIMILTTNRINSLDVAVQSRIHLAIKYDDLKEDQKKKIFRTFLDQLEPENIKNYDDIIDFVDEYGCQDKLNGREIRNVVSSALSLARSQAKFGKGDGRLTKKHLRDVMAITKDFQEQLESITKVRRAQNEAGRPR